MEKQIDRWQVHLHALNTEGVWFTPQLEPRHDAWIIIEYRADDYGCVKLANAGITWKAKARSVQRWMYLPINAQGHEPNTLATLFAENANNNAHPTL